MTDRKLLSSATLGALELPNRLIMAPLTRCRAGDGYIPQPINATYYAQRASAGLIISEATQVDRNGIGYPNTPGIFKTCCGYGHMDVALCLLENGYELAIDDEVMSVDLALYEKQVTNVVSNDEVHLVFRRNVIELSSHMELEVKQIETDSL